MRLVRERPHTTEPFEVAVARRLNDLRSLSAMADYLHRPSAPVPRMRPPSRRGLLPLLIGVGHVLEGLRTRVSWAQGNAPGIAVFVHPRCPAGVQNADELASYFLGTRRTWSTGERIILFNLPNGNLVRDVFDRVVLKMDPTQISRYWLDRRIRGEGSPPRQVPTGELISRLVATLPGSMGYALEDKLAPGIRLVARIRNGQVVKP